MRLQHADFRAQWDRIRPGIVACLEHQREGMLPEDVFSELRIGNAVLFLCDDCFVVVKSTWDGSGNKQLLIFIAYSFVKRRPDQESILEEYTPDLEQIARTTGSLFMTFASTRRGYERAGVLPDGWEHFYTVWRRRISA